MKLLTCLVALALTAAADPPTFPADFYSGTQTDLAINQEKRGAPEGSH